MTTRNFRLSLEHMATVVNLLRATGQDYWPRDGNLYSQIADDLTNQMLEKEADES
jgi:hypothetical protein